MSADEAHHGALEVTAPTGAHLLTLGQAVAASTVSLSTMRRKIKAGQISGAWRDEAGTYQIPISGLVAAGVLRKVSPPDTPPPPTVEALEAKLVAAEHRAQLAEIKAASLAAELMRADAHLVTLGKALAMLEAGPRPADQVPASTSSTTATTTVPSRPSRWWHRGR